MTEPAKECNADSTHISASSLHQSEEHKLESYAPVTGDSSNSIPINEAVILGNNSTISNHEDENYEKELQHTDFTARSIILPERFTSEETTFMNAENHESNFPSRKEIHKVVRSHVVSNESNDDIGSKTKINLHLQEYRTDLSEGSDNTDSSETESSSTVSEDNENSDDDSLSDKSEPEKKQSGFARTKGELSLNDLPPIEDLKITIDESKCKPVGTILNIVDTMVVIQSLPNTPPLDIDTVLFLDRGQRAIGKIFDVFGPVQEPLYCVRFNSREHVKEKNITKEQIVYCAPHSEYTSYIHTELLKTKGSDASWIDNNEPPVTCLDFSDDEEEAHFKHTKATIGSKRDGHIDNDLFVKKMNQRNLELTAKRKKEDEAKQRRISLPRRVILNPNTTVDGMNASSPSFSPFMENYKFKSRSFANNEQRSGSFHHNSSNSHTNKFDSPARSVNFIVNGGYNPSSGYAFPPQHFLCSSQQQLPNVPPPNATNYLTIYSRPPVHSSTAIPPPLSNFSGSSIPSMTAFASQPSLHLGLPPTMHPPMPQFSNYSPLPTPPLPSSLPQPNFFPCTDTSAVRQPTFIPLNVRPSIPAPFHPQFVLPPPPPPPPPSMHPRDIARPDRRVSQPSHQTVKAFYHNSPFNS